MTDPETAANLRRIYQTKVTEAVRSPLFREENLSAFPGAVTKKNPLCGDVAVCLLRYDAEKNAIRPQWDGEGCLICAASAEIGCTKICGKTPAQVKKILYTAFTFFKAENPVPDFMEPFSGVKDVPSRLKCVKLFWDAAREAFQPYEQMN